MSYLDKRYNCYFDTYQRHVSVILPNPAYDHMVGFDQDNKILLHQIYVHRNDQGAFEIEYIYKKYVINI